jgi:hypothetical protein
LHIEFTLWECQCLDCILKIYSKLYVTFLFKFNIVTKCNLPELSPTHNDSSSSPCCLRTLMLVIWEDNSMLPRDLLL